VLGRLLKELREAAGMTQRDLASKLDRTHAYVWKVETGVQHVDVAVLLDIASILGGDAADLVARVRSECERT